MLKKIYQEFKPTIHFIAKFFLLYIVLNVAYGLYIEYYDPDTDPVTHWVTSQSTTILQLVGEPALIYGESGKSMVTVLRDLKPIVAVYEGCNGLNVMIVFISFIFAFSPLSKKMFIFIGIGILVIHAFNLGRIILLYFVSVNLPNLMYFTHKYLFTAFIYIAVFLLWYLWIFRYDKASAKDQ